jgi:hypothetical protein
MSYTKPKMLDQSGTYILDELNPDAPSAAEYARLSNENRELRHELHNLRKDYEAVKLAKSLSDDWAVARADESQPLRRPTIADATESSKTEE